MSGPGSNGSRGGPGRRRTRSHEVCSSGRCYRRTRRWPGGRSRTLARPRRRASPMHGELPRSATQNEHAYTNTYRPDRAKRVAIEGKASYLESKGRGVNSQSGNFDPLRNYDRPSPPTKIIATRSTLEEIRLL